ncbi:hypothetical protein PLUA15_110037 [Pseudomonas lundensis]|uniref:Uncharacterized protein n=1 Tax=Pseudomonas lundensis TaxID=86185 RepID=A0AAX2H243_9PSED|nr:hypothetical protein PLUA15_110037 [Pseudomonas lundensis]
MQVSCLPRLNGSVFRRILSSLDCFIEFFSVTGCDNVAVGHCVLGLPARSAPSRPLDR